MGSGGPASGAADAVPSGPTALHPSTATPATGQTAAGVDQSSATVSRSRDGSAAARVRIRVLGPPAIQGVPVDHHVRPQALEFLTYLIVRGGSVHQKDIFDDLMPEPTRRKAAQRLHTYTYNLRQTFTLIAGERNYLQLRRHRYTLANDAFDVDLWSMRGANATAARAADSATRIAALRRAVDMYAGPFADTTSYLWVAAYRKAVHGEYVNAVVVLAEELREQQDREAAVAVLAEARRRYPDDDDLAAAAASLHYRMA